MKEQELRKLKAEWYKTHTDLAKKVMERVKLEIIRLEQLIREGAIKFLAKSLTEEEKE